MFTTMMGIIIALAICGAIVWLLEAYVIKSEPFKIVIRVVVVLFLLLWLVYYFGPKIDQMLSR